YELFETDDVESFLANNDFDGINVTIPYKQTVIPFCAELSDRAKAIGSVNTIVRRADGTLFGDNTDYYGFQYMMRKAGVDPRGKKAIVLGSGGASKTVCAVLANEGAEDIAVISRNGENNYQNLSKHADAQIIVNTTPVGMYPNCGVSPVSLECFEKCEAVLDVVYNPSKTELIRLAEEKGIACANGLSMLVAQAKFAGEIFTGRSIPESEIDRTTEYIESMTKNIVLIGMPGCGKSSVGRMLSELTGREFSDLDIEIERKSGKSIPQIFAEDGEAEFRRIETEVLDEFSKKSGMILAAGGGIVTRPINKRLLRRNSTCVWIRREIKDLPTNGRPVSQAKGVEQIYAERLPLYMDFAERVYDNCGIRETAEKIREDL
ncbi:MAG: shikimate kinase, partial [Christensenellaceae bacterium]|nr:shikimate kinase [Christensenellaceae bacterium]